MECPRTRFYAARHIRNPELRKQYDAELQAQYAWIEEQIDRLSEEEWIDMFVSIIPDRFKTQEELDAYLDLAYPMPAIPED